MKYDLHFLSFAIEGSSHTNVSVIAIHKNNLKYKNMHCYLVERLSSMNYNLIAHRRIVRFWLSRRACFMSAMGIASSAIRMASAIKIDDEQ